MATTPDRTAYHTLAKLAKRSGVPRPLVTSMAEQGLFPLLQVPGHLPVAKLDDFESAVRAMEIPAAHPGAQAMS
jgi:hypothetical protein